MAYAIQSFQCTNLGIEQLQLARSNKNNNSSLSLTKDEMECLFLIQLYRDPNTELSQLSKLEVKFQELYQKVNLTGMVVVKLLKFYDVPVPNPNLLQDTSKNNLDSTPQISGSRIESLNDTESNSSFVKASSNDVEEKRKPEIDPVLAVASGAFVD